MDVKNSTALVTGANRGLGKAIVEELLRRGAAKVYAGARDPQSVATADPRVVPLLLDVTDHDSVYAAAAIAGDVDLLVNNAGIGAGGSLFVPTESSRCAGCSRPTRSARSRSPGRSRRCSRRTVAVRS